jgi:Mn2+/Fe2+ NRAMP family transporter
MGATRLTALNVCNGLMDALASSRRTTAAAACIAALIIALNVYLLWSTIAG